MTKTLQIRRVNMLAFAQEGDGYQGSSLLQDLERIRQEAPGLEDNSMVAWHARGELRPGPSGEPQVWLHVTADADVPLTCQRCMGPVHAGLHANQWFRFVATEDIAMAEDDQSEEDLLVMEPQFDLLALVEDELLMAMPLVPMHETCPNAPVLSAESDLATPDNSGDHRKPNPFAVLAQIKRGK